MVTATRGSRLSFFDRRITDQASATPPSSGLRASHGEGSLNALQILLGQFVAKVRAFLIPAEGIRLVSGIKSGGSGEYGRVLRDRP
jgi:hypothetical protein